MDGELKAVLGKLTEGLERLTQGQERLTQGQERLTQGLERLTHGQDILTQGQERLRADLLGLRTVMMERFERVEDKLTSLSEDVSVNMMAVQHQHTLRRAERENAEQLTALVLKMEQQILRLQTDVDELKKGS